MRKSSILAAAALLLTFITAMADTPMITLAGRVKEATFKTDLTKARVITYDSIGNPKDTITANQGYTYNYPAIDTISIFYMKVPRVDTTLVFDVECEGYSTETITYALEKPGKREQFRRMPIIYLRPAPTMLKEVTVQTTKIKFYNKGDTVVYNADAFQLAEGSMLDALVAQLPGVELNSNGQIKVNGEFVESLLLNGREFMDGNNNVMLENIAAYTVKNIQVYEGQKKIDVLKGDLTAPKVLTMDVKLKKEYNIGLIMNAQAGYGTEDRYLGRLFAQWFNPTTRVTLIGMHNNLNDNRTPGRDDTWTPDQMPTGTRKVSQALVDYSYENPEMTRYATANLNFAQTVNNSLNTTSRTNFLPNGDTYDYSFARNRMRETNLMTHENFFARINQFTVGTLLRGMYSVRKNVGSNLSSTFSQEQTGITSEILDALYSDGSAERLDAVINRTKTRTDGWSRTLEGSIHPSLTYNIPRSNSNISLYLTMSYSSVKEHSWRDYDINYGADPTPAYRLRQYVDNTPNHDFSFDARLSYNSALNDYTYLSIAYGFNYGNKVKDSNMYALDRLADMGAYGVLPADYLDSFDPANSYTSRLTRTEHSLCPTISFNKSVSDDAAISLGLGPRINLIDRHLDYWRNDRSYSKSKTDATVIIPSIWDGRIEMQFNKKEDNRGYRNSVRYSYRIDQSLPDLVDMLDITDDSDPLNIYYGNPDLKRSTAHRHLLRWAYSPASYTLANYFYASYSQTSNAITRGYTYDTATGVRHNRSYNVDGNRTIAFTEEFNLQFGDKKQFTLDCNSDLNISRLADMIGVDLDAPMPVKVTNNNFTQKLRLGWNFSGQTLRMRGEYTNRHTTSSQPGFNTINAYHINYGISGVFSLPAGFGISTDFMCYTRHGYGSAYLDTTDPVWNMRLTYAPPRNKHFVITLDGFDLLHKLSNVNYAVNAAGRTVSYTNTIPRYVLLTLQYKLNIQPKKR